MLADMWYRRCSVPCCTDATITLSKGGKYWTLRAACPVCGTQMARRAAEGEIPRSN